MSLDKIKFEYDAIRIIRFGFGKFHGDWFIRLDLWNHAWRLSF